MYDVSRDYLRTVAELQEIARQAPYVTQDWVLQVASMDPADMRRRLIRSNDWHGHFAHSLDGIKEIQNMPGAGIDGCRSHKEVRAIVLGLLEQIKRLQDTQAGEADLHEMVRWAYGKLHRQNYTQQADALMLDRMKLMLEHGVF